MFKKLITMSVALLLSGQAVSEISNKEYAKCAIIDGDLSRLECFDNLAEEKRLDGRQDEKVSISEKGKWIVNVDVNPIDDSKRVVLLLEADTGRSKWGKEVALIVRCLSGDTDFYIGWNDYLGSEVDVLTRIGDSSAETRRWGLSTDKKASFHPDPIPFLKDLVKSSKLLAQVTPYSESPVTAVFDTAGLKNAIKPLRETCEW